jgi:RHS repeat-associated protein
MNMKGLESSDKQTQQNKKEHLWQYNGKERQDDFNLFWADYGARNYDSQVGRWHSVDPLAKKYHPISPYAYVANNPIKLVDPDGKRIKVAGMSRGIRREVRSRLRYLAKHSSSARGVIRQLRRSKHTHRIVGVVSNFANKMPLKRENVTS